MQRGAGLRVGACLCAAQVLLWLVNPAVFF
jgi:hypothetical protein